MIYFGLRSRRLVLGLLMLALGGFADSVRAQAIEAMPPEEPSETAIGDDAPEEAEEPSMPAVSDPDTLPASPCTSGPGFGPEMVLIEAGRFVMGSPESEAGRLEDEGPRREVVIVRPFAIARCETTVAEFRAFVQDTGYGTEAESGDGCYVLNEAGTGGEQRRDRNWRDPGFSQTDSDSVVCVSWNDAVAYADWLSRRTGLSYRLPSEAEWEYAARAGSTRSRFWGDDPDQACSHANVGDQTAQRQFSHWTIHECEDGHVYTAPVGSYRRNAFGLSDMLGNVWEWVRDCWQEDYQGAPMDGSAREEPECAQRVVRGGGWSIEPEDVRSAFRGWNAPDDAFYTQGFRLARDL